MSPQAGVGQPLSRVVLASGNAGKIREFSALLEPLGLSVVPQSSLGIGEAPEPHLTFVENALAKARHAAAASGLPALADDSGICMDALGGAPGVHSARWAAMAGGPRDDAANNRRLADQLREHTVRSGHYYCVLVLVRSVDDPQPIIADGVWRGEFIDVPRGDGGFGYDAHFLLPELGCTAAELSAERKNAVSHRGQAMRALVESLHTAGLARR
jgi:XTP/dITP diphosphohydrolase